MAHKNNSALALTETALLFTVRADEITECDIVKHTQSGDIWQVVSEPEYTDRGITFEMMSLSDDQECCFITAQPHQRFELLSYQPKQPSAIELAKQVINPCFVHSLIHQGQLIGILQDEAGFAFRIFSPSSSFGETPIYYPNIEAALNAATRQVEQDCRWEAGFHAYERGESFPEIADVDFARGWRDGFLAYQGVKFPSVTA